MIFFVQKEIFCQGFELEKYLDDKHINSHNLTILQSAKSN